VRLCRVFSRARAIASRSKYRSRRGPGLMSLPSRRPRSTRWTPTARYRHSHWCSPTVPTSSSCPSR
jgi:hypothetical protein